MKVSDGEEEVGEKYIINLQNNGTGGENVRRPAVQIAFTTG